MVRQWTLKHTFFLRGANKDPALFPVCLVVPKSLPSLSVMSRQGGLSHFAAISVTQSQVPPSRGDSCRGYQNKKAPGPPSAYNTEWEFGLENLGWAPKDKSPWRETHTEPYMEGISCSRRQTEGWTMPLLKEEKSFAQRKPWVNKSFLFSSLSTMLAGC